jgi:hypothetical protein
MTTTRQLPSDFNITVWVVETTELLGRILERVTTLETHANIATRNGKKFEPALNESENVWSSPKPNWVNGWNSAAQLEKMTPDMRGAFRPLYRPESGFAHRFGAWRLFTAAHHPNQVNPFRSANAVRRRNDLHNQPNDGAVE